MTLMASLVPGAVASGAEAPVTVSVAPSVAGNTAVHAGQTIVVSGTLPAGPITAATLIAQEDGGTTSVQEIPVEVLNRADDGDLDFLKNDSGNLSGRLTLTCIFREPVDTCPTPHGIPRNAVLQIHVGDQTGGSPPLRVDFTRPVIEGYRLMATNAVIVDFSEPVHNLDGHSALDWTVTDPQRTPLMVDGSTPNDCTYEATEDATAGPVGCTLKLTIQDVAEDDEPFTGFTPALIRKAYTDFASNSMQRTAGAPNSRALDKVPPRVPRIAMIDNKDATSAVVSSRTQAPVVAVDGATNGHTITLYRESSPVPGFNKASDVELGTKTVAGGQAIFDALPPFMTDGPYTLYALATDIHGNDSLDSSGSIAADDAAYVLDRVSPQPLQARATGASIAVSFTEKVTGTDDPSQWSVVGCTGDCTVQGVTGSGDTRVLQLPSGAFVPTGAQVSWTGGNYADAAGNPLAPFSVPATQGSTGIVVDLEPEQGTQAVARDYTLKLTVKDGLGNTVAGASVGIRAASGPTSTRNTGQGAGVLDVCTSQADGSCTVSYSSNATGLDTLQAWLKGPGAPPPAEPAGQQNADNQDVVTVSWITEGADIQLDATPETSAGSIDDAHVVTVSVKELGSIYDTSAPANIQGVNVDLEATSGPNKGWLGQCDTGIDGTCQISHSSTTVTDSEALQTWIDRNRDNTTDDDLFLNSVESRDADGLPAIDDPSQDALERTWLEGTVVPPPPPPGPGERSVSMTSPSSPTVKFGEAVRIEGTVLAGDGCQVDHVAIERRSAGTEGFEPLGEGAVDDGGSWEFTFTPEHNADYRATVAADSSCDGATSDTVFIGVKSTVKALPSKTKIKKNRCTKIHGTVKPSAPGAKVILQRRRPGGWGRAGTALLNGRSRYTLPVCFGKVGPKKLRVRSVGTDSNLAGISRWMVVRVTRP